MNENINIENFIAEFPEVVKWEIKVGKKKRGRWRTPVLMQLEIDANFVKTYNPTIPRLSRISFFEGTLFQEKDCGEMSCIDCKNDFFKKLGFTFYDYENPKETTRKDPCKIFTKKNDQCYTANFFLDWKPGIPDYSKEIEILTEIMKSLEKEVLYSLSYAYDSTELEEILITRQTETIKKTEEEITNKTKRKINIS